MDTREVRLEREISKGYALSGQIMLSAIIVLFVVVVFMVGLHLYARWYLLRLRRRQIERRRQQRGGRTHVVLYADSRAAEDRGLALAVINSLPYFLYSAKAEQPPLECAVCLSEFERGDIVRLLPKCNHNFHLDCIDTWFRSHSTCPLCRSAVEEVPEQFGRVVKPVRLEEELNRIEPGTSSGSGLCATCHHEEASGNGSSNCNTTLLGDRKRWVVKPVRPMKELNRIEPGTSSGSGLCAMCHHEDASGNSNSDTTSLGGRKNLEVRIEVPSTRTELDYETTQSSPSSRFLALKRILSISIKSPVGGGGGGAMTSCGVGTSGVAIESDLESGTVEMAREWSRFQKPV